MTTEEIAALSGKLSRFLGQFDLAFKTRLGRAHFRTYIEGQLGPLERKSVEPIADAAGVRSRNLQEFLSLLRWDEDAVRDKIHEIVVRNHRGAENILINDESGFAKKGTETACVQRQYCGATGKVDNCVVADYAAFASGDFHTLIDAELYLPEKTWHEQPERRRKAGIPPEVVYRPVHEIALGQIERARDHGVPIDWVTSDERYGEVPAYLAALEKWGLSYVVEAPTRMTGWTSRPRVWETPADAGPAGAGLRAFPRLSPTAPKPRTIEDLAAHRRAFREQPWIPYRTKDTEKGPEVWEVRRHAFFQHRDGLPSPELQLLVVRNVLDRTVKYFVASAPAGTPTETLLRVAFTRWRVERSFEDAKGEIGMDHFEVRRYLSVKRHLILSMVSHLFLAEQRERLRGEKPAPDEVPAPDGVLVPA